MPVAKSLKSCAGVLNGAGAELRVDQDAVGDDRDLPVEERVNQVLAVEVRVARIVRVHGYGGVTEHGLGPGGGDHDLAVHSVHAMRELEELAVGFLVIHLEVRE